MSRTNAAPKANAHPKILELGDFLISRYLQVDEHWARNRKPKQIRLMLLEQLEKLLACFLDRSAPLNIRLAAFHHDNTQSYFIEFNAPPQTATRIEGKLAALFYTEPHPFKFERYLGDATNCLKLTKTTPHPTPPKPQLGLSPQAD